jgi:hypothetical protein
VRRVALVSADLLAVNGEEVGVLFAMDARALHAHDLMKLDERVFAQIDAPEKTATLPREALLLRALQLVRRVALGDG